MQKRYQEEFKRDVVAVARQGDLTRLEVVTNFGVVEETVCRWILQADMIRESGWNHPRGAVRVCAVAPGEASPGDGERNLAPRSGVFRFLNAPKMTYPLVRDLAAEGFSVRPACGMLGFAT